MSHDRIRARKPTADVDRWTVGTVERTGNRDGNTVFEVRSDESESVELVVTAAIGELVEKRLGLEDGESPVGARVWYRKRGG
ncbi:hypothetical protein C491_14282 [Natronococcus amylolyticus DSM 10524]|uniref:Uncharacterized protein n=1 Tax=Natronococcus amylolyticus DSM 10524 TaxID=1227497 RepID=L9X3E1_9EURY|nr:hypothetical protein [Natronococcus amylolyticus]ELY56122.1 hypothetical protein C491_14282 [Natronococcus amylolyticus DSM 10524]